MTETQLKSSGPKLIKLAASESTKPPRTSPFTSPVKTVSASPQVSGFPATDAHPPSSPQTRKLIAPESLKRPQTPPTVRHTSSPQSRKLAAPESLRRPQTPPTVHKAERYQQTSSPKARKNGAFDSPHRIPLGSYATASPLTHHRESEDAQETESDSMVNNHPLNALPRSSALAGDGWLDSHSGAGSQASIGSYSPKPQSVHHFVVDLQEDGGSTSQSQKSEVDCSYILPSKEVESVFVSSGYLYVTPQSSDFNKTSPSQEGSRDHHTLEGEHSPTGERDKVERKTEICETQFDSSTAPSTAILDIPSSTESATPIRHSQTTVRQGNQPNAVVQNINSESEKNKENSTTLSRKVSSESNSDEVFSGQMDNTNRHQSVADRRLAFERQVQTKDNIKKTADKPAKLPPTIPKRVSSISSVDIVEENGAESIKPPRESSSAPLQEEGAFNEENRPPPPPMSTHPGLTNKVEVERRHQFEVQEEKEDENSTVRPKPKQRRISIPTIKPPKEHEMEESSLEPVTPPTIKESPKPSDEVATCVLSENDKPVNGRAPAPPQKDRVQDDSENMSGNIEGDNGQQNAKESTDYHEEESPSISTFGLNVFPLERSASFRENSEQQLRAERELNAIDPSKNLGAEVSTFKPKPKPRSFQRHSMYGGYETPATMEPPDYASLSSRRPETYTASATSSLLAPPPTTHTYTPEMKRSGVNFASPANKREILLRAQSMSILPTNGSASPRMMVRGEQRSQMPPGFVVFSRSQEAVIGRHASMSSNMALRTIKASTAPHNEGKKKGATPAPVAPMNTKRTIKKRRSIFRKK